MSSNIELKAFFEDFESATSTLGAAGYASARVRQVDSYFLSAERYVKLRTENEASSSVIAYSRSMAPFARPSEYQRIPLENNVDLLNALRSVKPAVTVRKSRTKFFNRHAVVNLDEVEGVGRILEIEILDTQPMEARLQTLGDLRQALKIEDEKILPYSNVHLVSMGEAARQHCLQLPTSAKPLLVIDGSSASGKSTLKDALLARSDAGFSYATRHTTRKPRPGDELSGDYLFISAGEFFESALTGKYVECRDYEFGMSYGLPWQSILAAAHSDKIPIALINLGNGYSLKRLLPNAVTVLLVADPDTVEARLRSRGNLSESQISERVTNAKSARSYAPGYDYVIDTGRTDLAQTIRLIDKYCAERGNTIS